MRIVHQALLEKLFNGFFQVLLLAILGISQATSLLAGPQGAGADDSAGPAKKTIRGTVIEQRKYTIRVASGEEDFEISLPDGLPIDQRLDRPRLDLSSNVLLMDLVASQDPNAELGTMVSIEEELPPSLGIVVEFAHENERKRLLAENPKRLIRYRLVPLESLPREPDSELLLAAKVSSVDERGLVTLVTGTEQMVAELGSRDARLGGRTIMDLVPFSTEVEIKADWSDNRWVAQEVVFRRVNLAPGKKEGAAQRLLVLGDEISISYLYNLRKTLQGKYSVHHPPENCRGSANWDRLQLWLGPYRQAEYQWDAIVLNFGLADLNTEPEKFREVLKNTFADLRPTGARIFWLNNPALPNGWQGNATALGKKWSRAEAQKKLDELNAIAAEEVSAAGQQPAGGRVQLIDLASLIAAESESRLAGWSSGNSAMFDREQAEVVAELIANEIEKPLPADSSK